MDKPLPDIPIPFPSKYARSTQNPSRLTVDSSVHLRRLIWESLREEQLVGEGGTPENEVWVEVIIDSLRQVGDAMVSGGWLAGVKRARMQAWKARPDVDTLISKDKKGKGKARMVDETEGGVTDYHLTPSLVPYDPIVTNQLPRTTQDTVTILRSLKEFLSKPILPAPKPTAKHLLLIVSPFEGHSHDHHSSHTSFKCSFSSGTFSIPTSITEDSGEFVLIGLQDWDVSSRPSDYIIQVVGGTFNIGVTSLSQYKVLTRVLRLSLYVYMSILLEQQFTVNSHVTLRFPKSTTSPVIPSVAGGSLHRASSNSHVIGRPKRESGSGLWAYISKKKDNFFHFAAAGSASLTRRGSIDSPALQKGSSTPSSRTSEDGHSRPRRLSFISDLRTSFMQPHKELEVEPPEEDTPFASTLSHLRKFEDLLSTSPGVRYPLPKILYTLAEREKQNPEYKPTGDERAALSSILGWEGKNDLGKSMAGVKGFVRHQGFVALYSEQVVSSRPPTPTSSQPSASSSTISLSLPQKPSQCGVRKRWAGYRFYNRNGCNIDECLGMTVMRICKKAEDPCEVPECRYKRWEHEMRWIHGGIRITASVRVPKEVDTEEEKEHDPMEMWQSCAICKEESKKELVLDGTFLFSFAKFLELLVYSPAIYRLTTPFCEHTTLPPRPWTASDTPLPRMRMNIVRNFTWRGRTVSFVLSSVAEIFEVRVPRLQIIKGKLPEKQNETKSETINEENEGDADRRVLRKEIKNWWQSLSDRIQSLEEKFANDWNKSYHKALPRLPSTDEAYESFEEEDHHPHEGTESGENAPTPKPRPIELPPDGTALQDLKRDTSRQAVTNNADEAEPPREPNLNSNEISPVDTDSLQLLSSLRHTFQRTEQELYVELTRTSVASLNDVRRSFLSSARGATRRLCAWEVKHLKRSPEETTPTRSEPEWFRAGYHAVPGANVIIRENDWGSIIAFTLGSADYRHELAGMSTNRQPVILSAPPPTPALDSKRPSFFSRTVTSKWFPPSTPQPDPDEEGTVWHEPEAYSAVICRKEHPRDPTSLLSLAIPELLRPKTPGDSGNPTLVTKFASVGSSASKGPGHLAPPSAWAKPDVQITMHAADGKLSGASTEVIDKMLHDLEVVSASESSASRRVPSISESQPSSSGFETNIRRGKASSLISVESDTSTIGPPNGDSQASTPPPLPPKDKPIVLPNASTPRNDELPLPPPHPDTIASSTLSTSSTFTSSLTAALRYMTKPGYPPPPPAKYHHGLLSATLFPAIDERPHIKYDFTIGKRLKFSCTVYYAKQFDSLRRRCGIEDVFLRSLSQCEHWVAQGGKSRSNFWKTSDDQFIVKSLVNAWNVADLQVLIELGPSYFRHMDATANRPTVLAKLLGFYTVEIRNLETGNTQAKADLLVMENLFYKQSIAKTFDLKGIQGRKVKATASATSKTLFDGEWIEGQQRALTLVKPYSKLILDEAIRSDCEFLAKSNIMDYSLLLGIDEGQKQIACGLVDTIGSYTFAKTLEYKAKQGLNSGKEVTVIPPAEYQERFTNAMDNYFLACPDKWTKSPNDKTSGDLPSLPSVL